MSAAPPVVRPNCYACKHRGNLNYSHHSHCAHPLLEGKMTMLALVLILKNGRFSHMGVEGLQHGIQQGWFNWPLDYDPIWLESCNKFEALPPPVELTDESHPPC